MVRVQEVAPVWDFSIALSIRLILRTLPFLVLRLVVGLVWTAILAGAAFVALVAVKVVAGWNDGPRQSGDPQLWLVALAATLFGIGVVFLILRWLHKWALYRIKAAHIAVLVEHIQGRDLPEGMGQLRYGQVAVNARFGEAAAFFVLDEMIKAALRGINRMANGISLPFSKRNGDIV